MKLMSFKGAMLGKLLTFASQSRSRIGLTQDPLEIP